MGPFFPAVNELSSLFIMSTSLFVYTVYEGGGKKEHFSTAEMLGK
jgi:hypothetical protein